MWIATGRGKLSGTFGRRPVALHSSGQTIFSLAHIEGITLGAGEEVDEVAGGAGEGLVKDRLLRCMGQVLQQGLWQGKKPGVGRIRIK